MRMSIVNFNKYNYVVFKKKEYSPHYNLYVLWVCTASFRYYIKL